MSPTLSPREVEIARALSNGLSNDEIAKQLGITIGTVKSHLCSIYLKAGALNRAHMAAMAARRYG